LSRVAFPWKWGAADDTERRMQVRIGVQGESLQERRARRLPHSSSGVKRALQC
jgi:hypothetical protein